MPIKKFTDSKSPTTLFIIIGMSTAILLVTPVLVLGFFGYLLDKFFHSSPILLLIGLGIGFIGGIMNVFRMMQFIQRRKRQKEFQTSQT